jgi:hypothetical protein
MSPHMLGFSLNFQPHNKHRQTCTWGPGFFHWVHLHLYSLRWHHRLIRWSKTHEELQTGARRFGTTILSLLAQSDNSYTSCADADLPKVTIKDCEDFLISLKSRTVGGQEPPGHASSVHLSARRCYKKIVPVLFACYTELVWTNIDGCFSIIGYRNIP